MAGAGRRKGPQAPSAAYRERKGRQDRGRRGRGGKKGRGRGKGPRTGSAGSIGNKGEKRKRPRGGTHKGRVPNVRSLVTFGTLPVYNHLIIKRIAKQGFPT